MAAPCRKCGATKTEPVRSGLRSKLVRKLGYEMRKCARCRKLRLLNRSQWAGRSSSATYASEGEGPPAAERFRDPDGFHGCPRCGEDRFRRSRRNWIDRVLLRRPPMARCEECGYRFPIPQV